MNIVQRLGYYIVLFASGLHVGWVATLLGDDGVKLDTPTSVFYLALQTPQQVAWMLLLVSALAFYGEHYQRGGKVILCLIPQQITLLASAGAGLFAVMAGHYPDGYAAPRSFIFRDQWSGIWASLLHLWFVATLFAECRHERVRDHDL